MSGKAVERQPELTASFVRDTLDRAITAVRPTADTLLVARGDVDTAVHELIDTHIRYAGAQGLLTGLGGVLAAAFTMPANLAGLALVQARMVAGIAHLRGYDLDDPRVRNAVLASMLGEDLVDRLIAERKLPAPPMAIATAPVHDPELDRVLSAEVASELMTRVAGKRLAITIARKVPIVGGAFGMGADGFRTWQVGDYAARELRPRTRR
ncbi:EcsC family protein [Nocardioides sp. SR21]|uniref:EcsC family protein n=1 Tax=Nocardioides sp. SR21 TaxID=2919501 RepID=UPI001FA98D44|nr:EcsC family protein [Nocardioides sp. SR21]